MNEVIVKNNETQVVENIDYKAKAIEYLNSMGNKLPAKHQTQFLELAQAYGLNPFKREIYAVGYGENWNIITGYEVYLKRAERIGKLNGWKATIAGSGETMTATVTIYRKDWEHPFEHTVLFSEVCQKTKDGKLNTIWAKMPSFMCRKVAIAQAFRLCFPDEFGGMPYIADEMPSYEELKNVTPTDTLADEALKTAKTTPQKKYTKAQAQELADLMNSEYSDGAPIFLEADKAIYRELLTNGKVVDAIKQAKEEKEKRLATPFVPDDKAIEQELLTDKE